MISLWPDSFKVQDIKTPYEILNAQIKELERLTDDYVSGYISETESQVKNMVTGLRASFSYSFFIHSKFVTAYQFRVFSFAYEIPFYPVFIYLDSGISDELGCDKEINLGNEEQLIELLKNVFNTRKISDIISSLMTLSKSYLNTI